VAFRTTAAAARAAARQTRAPKEAPPWAYTLVWIILGWGALTCYVIWRQTGEFFPRLNHAYFWHWALLSTLVRTPGLGQLTQRCWIPMNGQQYSIGPLVTWLDSRQLYHLPFTFWFWHYGIRTALLPIGIGVPALLWQVQHATDPEHLRGLRLLTPKEHHRQLNGRWLKRFYYWLKAKPPGITLGDVTIPRELEPRHFLTVGGPGAGKTMVIRQVLRQVRDRGEAAIVGDPDGELTAEFFDEARGDVILGFDSRSPFWTPFLELREDQYLTDCAVLAASIIRGNAHTGTEIYFRDNARSLLRAMFQVIPIGERDDPTCFARFLALDRDGIRERLAGTSAAAVIDPNAADSGGGQAIISVANTAVEGFAHLPRREQTKRVWSAREWARTREGWIFFTATSETRAAAESVQGIWLDCLIRSLLARPIGKRSPQVWIVIDEMATMGYQPQLKEVSRRGRKRMISLMMGAQTIAQFRDIYGPNGATDLIGIPATKIILRIDDDEMARWASDQLGDREVERWRVSQSQSTGVSSRRDGYSLQQQRDIEKLVMASEIKMRPAREGYLAIDGRRTTVRIPLLPPLENHPGFIPRLASQPQAATALSTEPWRTL
jgi:hypothetical protein